MSETVSQPAVIEMEGVQIASPLDPAQAILEDVNWTVQTGEFWVVAAPEHAGKTDLLLHAAGLVPPTAGTCRVFGRDTREFDETQLAERLRLGFVFAEGKLFSQMTLAENIALPLRYHRDLPEAEMVRTTERLLELLELTPFASALPVNVAANWRQRAALARALALEPEVLLLDNPNGGLVVRHRRWLVDFLDQLWRGHEFIGNRPMTVVATTDDLQAWQHAGRKFAAVHEGTFATLGTWGGDEFSRNGAIKELLAAATEAQR